jgi:hypothetical protein
MTRGLDATNALLGERYHRTEKHVGFYPNYEKLKKQPGITRRVKETVDTASEAYQFIVDENSVENWMCFDFDDDAKEHPGNFLDLKIM